MVGVCVEGCVVGDAKVGMLVGVNDGLLVGLNVETVGLGVGTMLGDTVLGAKV